MGLAGLPPSVIRVLDEVKQYWLHLLFVISTVAAIYRYAKHGFAWGAKQRQRLIDRADARRYDTPRSELRLLEEDLRDPERRVVVLHGPAGSGKSSLAARVAWPADRRIVVSTERAEGKLGRDELVRVLGGRIPNFADGSPAALATQPPDAWLVVLDNLDGAGKDAVAFLFQLAQIPAVRVLVTSRTEPAFVAEQPHRFLSRRLATMLPEEAATLLRANGKLHAAPLADVRSLCEVAGSNPWALTALAFLTQFEKPTVLLARMRPYNAASAAEWEREVWKHVPWRSRKWLMLAAMISPIPEELFRRVARVEGRFLRAIRTGFFEHASEPGSARGTRAVSPLLQHYLLRQQTERRARRMHATLARIFRRAAPPPAHWRTYDDVEALDLAMRHALEAGRVRAAIRIQDRVHEFRMRVGSYSRITALVSLLVSHLKSVPKRTAALNMLGQVHLRFGNDEAAREVLLEAAALAAESRWVFPYVKGAIRVNLASACSTLGDLERAGESLDAAERLLPLVPEPYRTGMDVVIQKERAELASAVGAHDDARALAAAACAAAGASVDREIECRNTLTRVEAAAGHFDAALAGADETLRRFSSDVAMRSTVAHTYADVLTFAGRLDEAGAMLERTAQWEAAASHPKTGRELLLLRAELALLRGDTDTALSVSRLAIAKAEGARAKAEATLLAGIVEMSAGEPPSLLAALAEAQPASPREGEIVAIARELIGGPAAELQQGIDTRRLLRWKSALLRRFDCRGSNAGRG